MLLVRNFILRLSRRQSCEHSLLSLCQCHLLRALLLLSLVWHNHLVNDTRAANPESLYCSCKRASYHLWVHDFPGQVASNL